MTVETLVCRNPGVLTAELEGESVLLEPEGGQYYSLNEVGAAVWSALDRPRSLAELTALVTELFDVPPDRCRNDLATLVEDLAVHRLVRLETEGG